MKNNYNFKLIAGPCVVEDEKTIFKTSKFLKKICTDNNIELIFKSSYKKANRTKYNSFTGMEPLRALEILKAVKDDLNIPVITDIHETKDVEMVKNYVKYKRFNAFIFIRTFYIYFILHLSIQTNNTWLILMLERWFFFAFKIIRSIINNDYNNKKQKYIKKYNLIYPILENQEER